MSHWDVSLPGGPHVAGEGNGGLGLAVGGQTGRGKTHPASNSEQELGFRCDISKWKNQSPEEREPGAKPHNSTFPNDLVCD